MLVNIMVLFNLFIYFERERERVQRGGPEREGESESQADSTLTAWSPMQGLNSQTVGS